jgi:sodium/hydrogen antiporter
MPPPARARAPPHRSGHAVPLALGHRHRLSVRCTAEGTLDLVAAFGLLAATFIVSALVAGLVDRGPVSFPMIFLGLGLLLGGGGLGFLHVDVHNPALEVVGTLTLALVLFMDALHLEGGQSKRDWLVPALVLGPGTLIVIVVVAAAGILLLDLPVPLALMLGAVLSSTDAVVLRDIVRDPRVPRPIRRVLSVEAGTNDLIVLPLILVLVAVATRGPGTAGEWTLFALRLLVIGPATGFVVGGFGAWLMARADARFAVRREYQALYGVGLVLGAYAAGVAVGGDGFLAAFFAGLAVTVLDQTLCDCFLEFGEAAAEMSMLLAFVLFGALLSELLPGAPIGPGLALAGIAIFVARPLAIWPLLSLRSAALSRTARAFIAWFGPRGLNSLLFALLAVQGNVPGSDLLLALTGLVVLVSVVLHGASATPLSAWYGRKVASETLEEERVSTATDLFEHEADQVERISPAELARELAGDRPPIVLDVRSRSQYERDAVRIPGSVRVLPDSIPEWAASAHKDQPYVLYCT